MAEQHPLRSMVSLLAGLRPDIRHRDFTDDSYSMCVLASANRTLELLSQLDRHWDDSLVGYLVACLRPVCEDLIALTYLKQFPDDRNAILSALGTRAIRDGVEAQVAFFDSERPWQPILRNSSLTGDVESLNSIGARLGWPRQRKEHRFPSAYWMSKQVELTPIYKFIYKMTSDAVHFNPQNLLRLAWYDSNSIEFSLESFSKYYRDFIAVYGCYLYGKFVRRLYDVILPSNEHMEAIDAVMFGLTIQPRWPEMITFEECNLPVPDHVAAWRKFMNAHSNSEIRRVWDSLEGREEESQ